MFSKQLREMPFQARLDTSIVDQSTRRVSISARVLQPLIPTGVVEIDNISLLSLLPSHAYSVVYAGRY